MLSYNINNDITNTEPFASRRDTIYKSQQTSLDMVSQSLPKDFLRFIDSEMFHQRSMASTITNIYHLFYIKNVEKWNQMVIICDTIDYMRM